MMMEKSAFFRLTSNLVMRSYEMMVKRVEECSVRWKSRSLPDMMTWICRCPTSGSHLSISLRQLRRRDEGHTMSTGQAEE